MNTLFHFPFLLCIFTGLLLGTVAYTQDLCIDVESSPAIEDCSSAVSETGFAGSGSPDAELNSCLTGFDVVWWAYQFDPAVTAFEFDATSADVVLFEGTDCTSLTELACSNFITINNDPTLTYFVGAANGATFSLAPYSPIEDVCTGAVLIGNLACEATENYTGDPNACTDEEAPKISCLKDQPGTWYNFTTDPGVPEFSLTGQFELFEGSCGQLNSLGDCTTLPNPMVADPDLNYYILLDGNGAFNLTTPPAPSNSDCSSAIEEPNGLYSNCCTNSGETWFLFNADGDARTIDFKNLSVGGSLLVEVYDGSCNGNLIYSNNTDFIKAFPSCGIPYFLKVSSTLEDCGDFDLDIPLNFTSEEWSGRCTKPVEIPSPSSNGNASCVSSTNIASCFSGCANTNSVWFSVTTDPGATNMEVNINAGPTFDPQIQIISVECDLSASGIEIIKCHPADVANFAVNGSSTYFIQVASGPAGNASDFEICVSTISYIINCSSSTLSSVNASGDGNDDGPFCSGDKVIFTYFAEFRSTPAGIGNSCQLLQGIIPSLGPGWDLLSCPLPKEAGPMWYWYPEGRVQANVSSAKIGLQPSPHGGNELTYGSGGLNAGDDVPGGWYFVTADGPCTGRSPNDGKGYTVRCPGRTNVTLEFTLQVKEDIDFSICQDPDYLKVEVFTLMDGITGCMPNATCSEDEPASERYEVVCDGLKEVCAIDSKTICSGDLNLDFEVEICDGDANILVEVADESSPGVKGARGYNFANSGTITDILTNDGCSTETVIYNLFPTDPATGCKGIAKQISVNVYPEIQNEFNLEYQYICPGDNYILMHQLSCGTGELEYTWSTGEKDNIIPIPHEPYLRPGRQSVVLQVVDEKGCTNRFDYKYVTSQQVYLDIIGPEYICKGDGPTFPKLIIRHEENGQNNNDYYWEIDPPAGLVYDIPRGDTTLIIDDEASAFGTYSIKAQLEDEVGCFYDTLFNITVTGTLDLTLTKGACLGDQIELTGSNLHPTLNAVDLHIVQISNTIPAVTDTLIGPSQANNLSVLVSDFSGRFELRGTTVNGCQSATQLILPLKPIPDIQVSASTLCAGLPVNFSIANPLDFTSFQWVSSSGSWTTASFTDAPTATTSYTFIGIDANGCEISESRTVAVNPQPSVNISGSTTICNNGSSTLSANAENGTGTYTYLWSENSISQTITVSPTTATTYSVIITDAVGCTSSASIQVEPAAELSPVATTTPFCEGGSTIIDGGAGYSSWEWKDPSNGSIPGGQFITVSIPGRYSLIVTDATGCTGTTSVEVIEVADLPTAITELLIELCNDTGGNKPNRINLDLLVQNGTSGSWQYNGNTLADPTSVSVQGFVPNTYNYIFTTTSAMPPCQNASYTVQLIVEDCSCPSVAVGNLNDFCADDPTQEISLSQIQLTTEAGQWTVAPSNGVDLQGNTLIIGNNSTPGNYNLTYTLDNPGPAPCPTSSAPVSFELWAPLEGSLDQTTSVCNASAMGDLTSVILDNLIIGTQGGSWSSSDPNLTINGNTSVDFDGQAIGNYEFSYILAAPIGSACDDLILTTSIRVRDCNCPDLSINNLAPLCNSGTILDLALSLDNPDNLIGTWSMTPNIAGALAGSSFNSEQVPAGNYTFSYILTNPIAGCNDINIVTQDIDIIEVPTATLTQGTTLTACNAINDLELPYLFDLDTLVSGATGTWTANGSFPGNFDETDNTIDLTGVDPDNYVFTFVTNTALSPCDEVTLQLDINVQNCECPLFEVIPAAPLCTDVGQVNLDNYINGLSGLGPYDWTLIQGPTSASISNSMINTIGFEAGSYEFEFKLQTVPDGCNQTVTLILVFDERPQVTVEPNVSACNRTKNDDSHCIDLIALSSGAVGNWAIDPSFPGDQSDLTRICFDGLAVDNTYAFVFTVDNSLIACDDFSFTTTVRVLDCNCPNLTISTDPQILCQGESLDLTTLEDPQIVAGIWTIGNGPEVVVLQGGTTFNATGVSPGNYELIYTPNTAPDPDCDQFSQGSLEVLPVFSAGSGINKELCEGEQEVIELFDLLSNADTGGIWVAGSSNPANNGFDELAGTFSTQDLQNGTYEFMYQISSGGCGTDEVIIEIIIESNPIADAGIDQTISCEETAQLGGANTSMGGNYTYAWTVANSIVIPNADQPNITTKQAGNYTLTVSDLNGCKSSDIMTVTVTGDQEVDTEVTDPACEGQTGLLLVATTGFEGTVRYSLDNGLTFQDINVFENLSPGAYDLLVSDSRGCEVLKTFTVLEPPILTVDAGENREVLQGDDQYDLQAAVSKPLSEIETVTWIESETGDTLCQGSYEFCGVISVNPELVNTYCVTVEDIYGCTEEACVTLREKLERDIYLPNIFDPEATNPADRVFFVGTDEYIEKVNFMRVYDRWGELVFSAPPNQQPNDPSAGWNGRWNNEEDYVLPGVYIYVLEVTYVQQEGEAIETELLSGDLTIIR